VFSVAFGPNSFWVMRRYVDFERFSAYSTPKALTHHPTCRLVPHLASIPPPPFIATSPSFEPSTFVTPFVSLTRDDELATVMKLWKAGDADGLAREMFSEFDNPEYSPVYDALIVKRNERMTKQIETWLTGKERMFVVLGAGHFVGKDGIVAHLVHDGWVPHRI